MATAHISVCICTYKRPELLRRLLEQLSRQYTDGLFNVSIIVVDNDSLRSAEQTVLESAKETKLTAGYFVEPHQNIAMARNKAVANARGDLVAFIDDDELPPQGWLITLFGALQKYQVDGVLGPVKPHFGPDAPQWVIRGKFYDRPTYPTGFVIDWPKGRTGNVLLKRELFATAELPFRPEFLSGEDQDFFRRMIEKGRSFVWCDEAVAYETVPPGRWKRSFMLRRALLRGKACLVHPTFGMRDIARSMLAVPAYASVLPVALLLGQWRFMTCLVKLFGHAGTLLALVGLNPVREPYVTE